MLPAFVFAYDIACDRRRNSALRLLRQWRIDGQLSVHECRLSQPHATELFLQLAATLDPKTDKLLLVRTDLRHRRDVGNTLRPSELRLFQ